MRYRQWAGSLNRNRARMLECSVRVIDKALARPQATAARSRLERARVGFADALWLHTRFARLLPQLDAAPDLVPAELLRIWRQQPRRLRLLRWSLAMRWPTWLGGRRLTRAVHQKIRRKYGPN